MYPFSWFIVYRMLLGEAGCAGDEALALVKGEREEQDTEVPVLLEYVLTVQVEVGTPRG